MRHALRQLAKSPGTTVIAVLALALGLGANTAIFSVINTLFLRPLAFPDAEQLVRVWGSFPDRGLDQANLSWPRFTALRDQQQAFSHFAAESGTAFTLTGRGDAAQLQVARVTSDFFPTLGVQPLLGRGFSAADDQPGGPNVVLLSYAFWQRQFGGRSDIVGQALLLNGVPHTVIGILPASLGFPFARNQLWAPRPFDQEGITPDLRERGTGYLRVYGRLKPTVTLAQAGEQVRVISHRYGTARPDRVDAKAGLNVVRLQEDLVGRQRPTALTLLAAVGCVLLVACANVANLLLARFTTRRKEIAIRTALGASRSAIVRQFLGESLLTTALGGALGLLLAFGGLALLARIGEDFLPRAAELSVDLRVLGFALALSLATGVVLGIVPAWRASQTDPGDALKDSNRGSSAGLATYNLRAGLLIAEVALSLVLLVGAALLLQSFRELHRVDLGFQPDGVTTFDLALPDAAYPTLDRQARLFEQLTEKLRALPGVTHAAASATLPIVAGGSTRSPIVVEGEALPPVNERLIVARSTVTPGFFATLGVPLRQGRDFTWRDREGAPPVMIINEVVARRLFPGQDPIGRRLVTGIQSIPREIVGVSGALRSEAITEPPHEEIYYPAAQVDGAFLTVVLRSPRPAVSLRPEITAAVHALDAGLPVADVQGYPDLLAQSVADRRLMLALLGAFAVLALALAGMGIYSVISYSVAQRTNEIGIRMALGAAPAAVVAMVLKEGLRLALFGLAVGLLASLAITRLMSQLLFNVSATDPLVFALVSTFLTAVAALACYVPARRATQVDPLVALRTE